MNKLDFDSRLAAWSSLRKRLSNSDNPLHEVVEFWNKFQLTTHNHNIDQYYPQSWPTPWDILETNIYDDFTKAIMIGYTLLLSENFKDSVVQIKTMVDMDIKRLYNAVYVDEMHVLNFSDTEVVSPEQIPETCRVENLIILEKPR